MEVFISVFLNNPDNKGYFKNLTGIFGRFKNCVIFAAPICLGPVVQLVRIPACHLVNSVDETGSINHRKH